MQSMLTKKSFQFLSDLKKNCRDREWFELHKEDYREHLLYPLQYLAGELSDLMLSIDDNFGVMPKRVISRIYRDTRFSRDKSLFKSNMWITFKRPESLWPDWPAFFFEIYPEGYRYGMGFYQATSRTMSGLRVAVAEDADRFRAIMHELLKRYEVQGERYKKEPKHDLPEDLKDMISRKNFYLHTTRCKTQMDKQVAVEMASGFESLRELYSFLLHVKMRIAFREL